MNRIGPVCTSLSIAVFTFQTAAYWQTIAPAIALVEEAKAATTYFSADFETGNISQWDGCAPHAAGQNVDPVAVTTPSPVHGGQWSGNYTLTQAMKDIGIAQNDGAARQCYTKTFANGPGKGPQGGMLEGYFSAWYWFGNDFGTVEGAWHNVFQWHTLVPSQGGDQVFVFFADKKNGVFQVIAHQRNCFFNSHPLTQDCPLFTGPYIRVNDGAYITSAQTPIPKNQWVHFEAYYKASRANGAVKFWMNGQLLFDFSNANISAPSPVNYFDTLDARTPGFPNTQDRNCIATNNVQPCYTDVYWLVNNYLVCQNNPGTETMYVDDAKVSDVQLGPGGAILEAPQNLRVVTP